MSIPWVVPSGEPWPLSKQASKAERGCLLQSSSSVSVRVRLQAQRAVSRVQLRAPCLLKRKVARKKTPTHTQRTGPGCCDFPPRLPLLYGKLYGRGAQQMLRDSPLLFSIRCLKGSRKRPLKHPVCFFWETPFLNARYRMEMRSLLSSRKRSASLREGRQRPCSFSPLQFLDGWT